jgi:hypothetical protein
MKIYLAALECKLDNTQIMKQIYSNPGTISVLGSFFGIMHRNPKKYITLLPYFKDFMLDSGAFSFMNSKSNVINWDEYIEDYASYIKSNRIEKFFELDIDSLVGYEKVKEYRYKLERKINRQCIPVWHRSRGYEEYLRLCEGYSYVSIGGIAIKNIRRDEYKYFTHLIREAHRRNCKIHALGFTNMEGIREYHFDSVDSSSWNSGGRYGSVYKFLKGKMKLIKRKADTRISDIAGLDSFNFGEWVKLQRYAETHF